MHCCVSKISLDCIEAPQEVAGAKARHEPARRARVRADWLQKQLSLCSVRAIGRSARAEDAKQQLSSGWAPTGST